MIRPNDLLTGLLNEPEGPWQEYDYGRPITFRMIASILKGFGIKSDLNMAERFYHVADLQQAIRRHADIGNRNS